MLRHAPSGVIRVSEATRAWGVPTSSASRRLGALTRAGWISRVRRGVYRVIPVDASNEVAIPFDDPWILAASTFAPCYIGGWSAAEHWGLTEQLFAKTFVVTGAHVRARDIALGGLAFRVARVARTRAMGDANVWRGRTRVPCSSAALTIVDGCNAPAWAGGVRHLAEMVGRFVEQRPGDLSPLTAALRNRARGSGAKRLGFIVESLATRERDANTRNALAAVAAAARERLTTGVIKLDPGVRARGKMNTAWGIWTNVRLDAGADQAGARSDR
ncbi:MAG: type IV toxin-antitoxin system AbiEi family antitoxin domain-containing protein [Gemmatimonadaceae bacterium]